MPQYNRRELDVKAHEYGFNRDTFEKVLRLRTKGIERDLILNETK